MVESLLLFLPNHSHVSSVEGSFRLGEASLARHLFLRDLPSPVGRWRERSRECLLAEMLACCGGSLCGVSCTCYVTGFEFLLIHPPYALRPAHLLFTQVLSRKEWRYPGCLLMIGWRAVNAGPGSPSWVLLFLLQSSGPKVVYLLLIKQQKSPLVASCYFQDEERA